MRQFAPQRPAGPPVSNRFFRYVLEEYAKGTTEPLRIGQKQHQSYEHRRPGAAKHLCNPLWFDSRTTPL